jgi:cell division protein FtsW
LHNTLMLKRKPLAPGDEFVVDHAKIRVIKASPHTLVLEEAGTDRRVTWTGGRLSFQKEALFLSEGIGLNRIRKWMRWQTRAWTLDQAEMVVFLIGGRINTPDRWRLDKAVPGAVQVRYRDGRFFLAPGESSVVGFKTGDSQMETFSGMGIPLAGEQGRVQRVVLGKTYYRVNFDEKQVTLTPVARAHVWSGDSQLIQSDHPGLQQQITTQSWIGGGLSLSDWLGRHSGVWIFGLVLVCLAGAGVVFYHVWMKGAKRGSVQPLVFKLGPITAMVGLFWLLAGVWRSGDADIRVLAGLLWVAWALATFFLGVSGRLGRSFGWIWACALFFCGMGTLTLLQLGAGADSFYWITFAEKHLAVMILSAITIMGLTLLTDGQISGLVQAFSAGESRLAGFVRKSLVAGGISVMVFQLFWGWEGGLWGFQPSEGAKLFFVMVAAFAGLHLVELRRYHSDRYQARPVRFVMDIFMILALAFLALIITLLGVRDISPLVIMGILFVAWIWHVAPHPWKTTSSRKIWRMLVAVLLLAVFLFGYRLYTRPHTIPSWFPKADRFQVWVNPWEHPHSGAQVLHSFKLASLGGWTGAETSFFGKNHYVHRMPAVQDDFILGFVLYKFGWFAGLALAGCQVLYVLLLFHVSRRTGLLAEDAAHFKLRQTAKLLALVLFLLAWVHVAQWGLSWGNVLGFLPVMGQPMTWISAANSHMVFIGLPCVAAAFVASRLFRA